MDTSNQNALSTAEDKEWLMPGPPLLAVFALETNAGDITTTAAETVDDWNTLQVVEMGTSP